MVYIHFPKDYKRWNGSRIDGEYNAVVKQSAIQLHPRQKEPYYINIDTAQEKVYREALATIENVEGMFK